MITCKNKSINKKIVNICVSSENREYWTYLIDKKSTYPIS